MATTENAQPAPPILADIARRVEADYRLYDGCRRRTLEAALQLGTHLLCAREFVDHGDWQSWLEERGVPYRTAARCMQLAREAKSDKLSLLADDTPVTTALEILSALRRQEEAQDQEQRATAPRQTSLFDDDPGALAALLAIHARPAEGPRVVDLTYARGRLWRGLRSKYQPLRVDADPALHAQGFTDLVADWAALPLDAASKDVLVFDPPHITDAGVLSIIGAQYSSLRGTSINDCFEPMLAEARRVLVPGSGLLIAKLANQVHNSRYQDQARGFANAAEALGFEKIDEAIRHAAARGTLSGAWDSVQHLRQVHTYWLALRAPKDRT